MSANFIIRNCDFPSATVISKKWLTRYADPKDVINIDGLGHQGGVHMKNTSFTSHDAYVRNY